MPDELPEVTYCARCSRQCATGAEKLGSVTGTLCWRSVRPVATFEKECESFRARKLSAAKGRSVVSAAPNALDSAIKALEEGTEKLRLALADLRQAASERDSVR